MKRFFLALLFLPLVMPTAWASQQGVIVLRNWKAMDSCTQKAHTAFPDYTAEANAKRDAALQACLAGQNLPPREPLSSPHP
jgi:hypothetical protein